MGKVAHLPIHCKMLKLTWIIKNHEKKIMHIPPQDNCINCLVKLTNHKNYKKSKQNDKQLTLTLKAQIICLRFISLTKLNKPW
jgi:hypothetical protein